MQESDYVIVGAGSAGCVLANRLSVDPGNRVALLEAGGHDNHLFFRMPAGVLNLLTSQRGTWAYKTEPQRNLNNRSLYWPRGKVLGGSSSINGMIYIRGHAKDYDHWRDLGLEGWSYEDVLPYFRRSESNENGADRYHGGDGPMYVGNPRSPNPLFKAFVEAGIEAGYPRTRDFNAAQQEGFGSYQLTILRGERSSTSVAFLRPVLSRPNLSVQVNALATRVIFDGKRAVAVEYEQEGVKKQIRAKREVLLTGGVVNTPQLMQLSGLGDPELLRSFGIPVIANLPGVGRNLQDHLDCTVINRCLRPITLYSQKYPPVMAWTGMRYFLSRTGPASSNSLETGGFIRSHPDLDVPDVQLHFVLAAVYDHGRGKSPGHGFTVHACQLRPESRGEIRLRSADPHDHPIIEPNYLDSEIDIAVMCRSVRIVRHILGQKVMAPYVGEELEPGIRNQSDEAIDAWIRGMAETIYHPVGTARMGVSSDRMAVVDNRCAVFGVEGLRVVDASVMPTLVGGNTNAPTIMIAEKISDAILGKA